MLMRHTILAAGFLVVVGAVIMAADDWVAPSPQLFASGSGSYGLRTVPPKPGASSATRPFAGRSQAVLFGLNPDGTERPIWKGELVNIPHRAAIADSGKYFVTFDTWGRVGFEHSLVVYDSAGKVIADHALEAVLNMTPAQMIDRVPFSVSSRWWRNDAKVEFSPDFDQLVLTMKWGQVIRVTLATGKIDTR